MRQRIALIAVALSALVATAVTTVAATGAAARSAPASAARPPRRVSVRVTPNPAQAGLPAVVSGRLYGARGKRHVVLLWGRRLDEHRFRLIETTRARDGLYSFTASRARNTVWYVTSGPTASRTVLERVRAQVTLTSSQLRVPPDVPVLFQGRVTPSHSGQTIVIEQLQVGGWRQLARARLDRRSRFQVRHVFGSDAAPKLRAFLDAGPANSNSPSPAIELSVKGIYRIKHVVIIMQENRSFDQYFGTFPGADGIPGLAGNPGTLPCAPDPASGGCIQPFHDTADKNYGGPHGQTNAVADADCADFASRNGCRMDGFVGQAEKGQNCTSNDPACSPCTGAGQAKCEDAMGYHDSGEIPNYWTYARDFVLQDQMYEPNASWSLPEHLFQVSGWSAFCTNPLDPFSCANALQSPNPDAAKGGANDGQLRYAWTDITWLLHGQGVSWGYYVFAGTEPDCENDQAMSCAPVQQGPKTPGIWNPLPSFTDVAQDGQLGNVQSLSNFFTAAANGTLPAVSWIDPNGKVSEHPTALVSAGQTYVTGLINAVMRSPEWSSTAIFLSWDDWGGFYDHVVPPAADVNGYGLRVPGMVISPYAKQGYIDHQTLSHDAYNKFIEDDFLGGQRLDPRTDGRPDPRPDVREASPLLGDLAGDFDFRQEPRAPVLLPVCPQTDLQPAPSC